MRFFCFYGFSFTLSFVHPTDTSTQIVVEPVKKKKLFSSLGKVIRKKVKSKSRSMTDLSRHAVHRKEHLTSQQNIRNSSGTFQINPINREDNSLDSSLDLDAVDGYHNNNTDINNSGKNMVHQLNLSMSSQDVEENEGEDIDDAIDDENEEEPGEDEEDEEEEEDDDDDDDDDEESLPSSTEIPSGMTVRHFVLLHSVFQYKNRHIIAGRLVFQYFCN